jgi:hypothetical protein
MTIQGLGYLLPTNLWVCIQLRRPDPDLAKISRTMRNYFFAVGAQGTMQVLTIVIMARDWPVSPARPALLPSVAVEPRGNCGAETRPR